MKKVLALLLALTMLVTAFAACGGTTEESSAAGESSAAEESTAEESSAEESEAEETGETVTMVYLIPGDEPKDMARGLSDVNAKMAEDGVGVEVELRYIAWDVWDQKINLMLSTGDNFDMFHVMNDRVTIANYASRNALADITEAFNTYGENIIANCPDLAIRSGQVGDVQYGIPAYWVESALNHQGLIRLDILEKYGIETVPSTWDELTEAFVTVMENWEGVQKPYLPLVGTGEVGGYMFNSDSNYVLYENMIYVGQDGTITNYFETEAFKESCNNARDWYEKGLINPDVLTVTNDQKDNQLNNGDWLVHFGTIGDITALKNNYPDLTVDDFAWLDFDTETPEIRPYGTRNMQAVPASSEHPEAAVKFVNWIYASEENFALFHYGTEGTDYTKLDGNAYEVIANDTGSSDWNFATWMTGNINYGYLNANAPAPTNEHLYTIDETAQDGIAALMTFDASEVQTQVADVNTQISALIAPMACGVVEYDEGIEEALAMLDKAGLDDIVAAFQAQYDASK